MVAKSKPVKGSASVEISDFDALMANRAIQLASAGRIAEAEPLIRQFIGNNPRDPRGYYNLGKMLRTRGDQTAALEAFRRCVKLAPGFSAAHLNLANTLRSLGRASEAFAAYRRTMDMDPDAFAAVAMVAHTRASLCDWDGLAEIEARAIMGSGREASVPPFTLLAMASTAAEQLVAGKNWGSQFLRQAEAPPLRWRPQDGRPIRVGYASTDFRMHPIAMLIAEMIEQHDRSRFQIHGYCFGGDDGSPQRQRLMASFDHFTELRGVLDREAAQKIASDEIDILVDLTGYTHNARTAVFGWRPAPILVNFLGYPGTAGVLFDYIVVDPTICPPEHRSFYSEIPVYMPHCYQPNDTKREIVAAMPSRQQCNLPEEGFVFCCFNNSFKIRPHIFQIWMRLLKQVPGSVLWLIDGEAAGNLRREAKKCGIDPKRLVFAPRLPPDQHLSRHRQADLFLDTLPYNAHTTASDSLWAGVPVLTVLGDTFASRVAASLVRGIGLPEMVVQTLEEYEQTALALAQDAPRLADLRRRLAENRLSTPLFDAAGFTRNLEAAYVQMVSSPDSLRPNEIRV
ncbi:MAG: tetratricopeptide repeat protein [Magnetospirillum sp.]|nr:tetratricopeptide repeat protein [Magnetospirillum sp.]